MDTETRLESLSPGDAPKSPLSVERPLAPLRQCSAVKKNGERCKSRPLLDGETCVLHSERGAQVRAKAVTASVEARQEKVAAREAAVEASKLTLTQWFARVAGEHAEQLARKAVDRALDGDVRALSIVLERVEGKVADHLITEAGDPFEMTEAQLAKWLDEPVTQERTVSNPAPTTDEQGPGQATGQD